MKILYNQRLPWFICLLLSVLLTISNIDIIFSPTPPNELTNFSKCSWKRFYHHKNISFWRTFLPYPSNSGGIDKFYGYYAITNGTKLILTYIENDTGPFIFNNGDLIAILPCGRNGNRREYFTKDVNGNESTLTVTDIDGDGIIDVKRSYTNAKYWLYMHGEFKEADISTESNTVKKTLDGKLYKLSAGKWEEINNDDIPQK